MVLLEIWRVLQSDLLQEAENADEGVELRKILSMVMFVMRSSFRKCGFRRLVGPVHERIHILQVAESEAGDESSRDLH